MAFQGKVRCWVELLFSLEYSLSIRVYPQQFSRRLWCSDCTFYAGDDTSLSMKTGHHAQGIRSLWQQSLLLPPLLRCGKN